MCKAKYEWMKVDISIAVHDILLGKYEGSMFHGHSNVYNKVIAVHFN